ncbi:hypothetical protein V1503_02050 [Bacillus sp. SCS-151]
MLVIVLRVEKMLRTLVVYLLKHNILPAYLGICREQPVIKVDVR